jgi:hypothetical protein
MTEPTPPDKTDVEAMLKTALRPIEPPDDLAGRMEETLSAVTEAAASELSAWAEELSDSELRSLRDPRNWVRPAAAVASGAVAGGALAVLGMRQRREKPSALKRATKDVRKAVKDIRLRRD